MDRPELAKPQAHTRSIEELVNDARRGRLRVPAFQRPLRWDNHDVVTLFDSVYRGYPIGSLLLWRRPGSAPEGPVQLGPVVVTRPDTEDVRWLVDGQQRVTALVAGLSADRPADPTYDVWFDPDARRFHGKTRGGPERTWVPVATLLDAAGLGEFLLEWPPGLEVKERRRVLLDAGKRIREYPLPAYVIESADDAPLRRIFQRMNRQGKGLTEVEVFEALIPDRPEGSGLRQIAAGVASIGWGAVDDATLLWAVRAVAGLDPTRRMDEPDEQDEAALRHGAGRLLAAVHQAIAFLRDDAGVPHLTVLPYPRHVLVVVTTLFARLPDLGARGRRLSAQWVWRNFVSGRSADDYVFLRKSLRAIEADDEEQTLAALLASTPRADPGWQVPRSGFRSDATAHRVGLVGLAALAPCDLTTGAPLDLTAGLEASPPALQVLIDEPVGDPEAQDLRRSVANRLFHPVGVDLRAAVAAADPAVLATHAIDDLARDRLVAGDAAGFLRRRAELVQAVVDRAVAAYADWGHDHRPSVRALVR